MRITMTTKKVSQVKWATLVAGVLCAGAFVAEAATPPVTDGLFLHLDGSSAVVDSQGRVGTWTNLVEIDLLGEGQPTTLARLGCINQPAGWRYIVSVLRNQTTVRLEAYPIPLRDRLPRCRIPLRAEDEDAVLDLPAVFTRCYDIGGYDLFIDYTQPPPVELDDADREWMKSLLAEKEMRMD